MPLRRRAEAEPADDNETEHARVLFRPVPVFDRSQVDPLDDREPAPLDRPASR